MAELRREMERIEGRGIKRSNTLPFGVPDIDQILPGGGITLGALHEVAGGASGAVDGAAAALFTAGVAARTGGPVLWCLTRPDLFAPGLAQAGLHPDNVIFVEAGSEKNLLTCFEDGLRHGGFSAVVAEVASLPLTASRRLQLAAESTGALGIALRRWRRDKDAADFGQPTASNTRWRVTEIMPAALPVQGVGRAQWLLELVRCRGGVNSADFEVEACDTTGFISLATQMANRSPTSQVGRFRAA